MSTVRTAIARPETLFVSSSVMSDLRALAMSQSDDPLLSQPDALGDAILRQALDTMPGVQERGKAIRAFFKQLPPARDALKMKKNTEHP